MARTLEEKLSIVQAASKGTPVHQLSKVHKLHEHKILEWIRKYKKYGLSGLKKQPNFISTPEIKEKLVREFLENGVTLAQIVVDYQVSRTALERWVRTVRVHGYSSLYKTVRTGRPPKNRMARPKKKEPETELERLQEENLRLRAEIALLKKVKALVKESKAQQRHNGQRPSMN